MAIDNSSAVSAVDTIKGYVANCFSKCSEKGSTFSGENKLKNLESAIDLIPTESGGGSGGDSGGGGSGGSGSGGSGDYSSINLDSASCNGLPVTYNGTNQFSLDLTGFGVTWKSIYLFDDEREGFFLINKINSTQCIISAHYMWGYMLVDWEFEDGSIGDLEQCSAKGAATHRATYSASGNIMTFTKDDFNHTCYSSNDWSYGNDTAFNMLPSQIDNTKDWSTYDPESGIQYCLRKITVIV